MSLTDQAHLLAADLNAAGVKAVVDPVHAQTRRPCVLVAPPSHDFTQHLTTWRVIALASTNAPSLRAFEELSELVDQVSEVLPVEVADPAAYPLSSEAPAVPAYVMRVTT